MAAVTHESMPPLSRTTALDFSAMLRPCIQNVSDALRRRIPDEFVQLQPQPHRQPVGQNPFREQRASNPCQVPLGSAKTGENSTCRTRRGRSCCKEKSRANS